MLRQVPRQLTVIVHDAYSLLPSGILIRVQLPRRSTGRRSGQRLVDGNGRRPRTENECHQLDLVLSQRRAIPIEQGADGSIYPKPVAGRFQADTTGGEVLQQFGCGHTSKTSRPSTSPEAGGIGGTGPAAAPT